MLSDASFQEECTSAEMNLSLAKNADSLKEVEREATASAERAKAFESMSTPRKTMRYYKHWMKRTAQLSKGIGSRRA